jgi:hypothetical protein
MVCRAINPDKIGMDRRKSADGRSFSGNGRIIPPCSGLVEQNRLTGVAAWAVGTAEFRIDDSQRIFAQLRWSIANRVAESANNIQLSH